MPGSRTATAQLCHRHSGARRRIACPELARLLFVSYSGILGGAERVLLDFAGGLPGEAIIACPPGDLAERARAAGVPVLALAERPLALRASAPARLRAGVAIAGHARDLRRLSRTLAPDLVVSWGMRSAIARLLGAGGRRYVIAHHDLLPGRLIGAAVRAAAARAALVMVPSQAVARDLDPRGRLGDRLRVVAPGVDITRFAGEQAPVSPPEILVLGAVTDWKRPDLALEAVALARRRLPDLRLRLVGGPPAGETALLERLRARAEQPDLAGAVELAGPLADPAPALARATCLLHCAPREPFGLAVLEALAAGRPVVASAACGPLEIVDSRCGELYPPGDATAAAAALVALVTDPRRATTMGEQGRRRARQRFDLEAARTRFASLARAAVGPRASPRPRAAPSSLAVVTVTHDSAPALERLLGSVSRRLPGIEIVVVDCASRDRSLEVARGHDGVTAIELGENLGFGRACNRGLAHVRAPVAALLNPDVELLDDSLLELAAEALRRDRPPRLLAPRVLNSDGGLQDTVHPRPGSPADLIRSLIPPAAVPGRPGVALAPWRAQRPRRVGWAVGCALVARTRTLRELGPFDESTFMYGEDLELGLHARQQGIATWLWPSARVIHRRAHATGPAFGGEAFHRLARARQEAVHGRLGPRWAAVDAGAQMITFASRLALKRMLGRPAERERRQLQATGSAWRRGWR